MHDSDDSMEEGGLEEPFDAPWDEHVGPESITTAYGQGHETAHTAAHARGGVWSSDLTKRAKSKFANNICGDAMLGFREDIRRSQFAWAQTWNNDMQFAWSQTLNNDILIHQFFYFFHPQTYSGPQGIVCIRVHLPPLSIRRWVANLGRPISHCPY